MLLVIFIPHFSLKLVKEIQTFPEHLHMELHRWMEPRASGRGPRRRRLNPREDLPEHLQLHHLPLKNVLQLGQQVHVWSCRTRRPDQCHRRNTKNQEYNQPSPQSQVDPPRGRAQPGMQHGPPAHRDHRVCPPRSDAGYPHMMPGKNSMCVMTASLLHVSLALPFPPPT